MSGHNIFLWLLVAYSITLIDARRTDAFASRLKAEALDSANDEHCNEISDELDIDEFYFPKRKELSEKCLQRSKTNLRFLDAPDRTADDGSPSLEAKQGLMDMIVSPMFNLMQRFFR